MEIEIPYSIIFFTFFCFFFLIHKLSSSSKKPMKTLPPGPWKLRLIGNLHQLVGSLPHRSLTNLANKYGAFMHLQLGQVSHIIVSSPEYAKEIMKTHDQIFANRPRILATDILSYNNTDVIFSPYGNYWRQLRKICTLELLSAKRVQSFRRIREEEVSELVRNISEHEDSVINLSQQIFALTNSIGARMAFGNKTKNVEQILQIIDQGQKISSGLSISDFYPSLKFLSIITGLRARVMKVHKNGDKVIDDTIRDHKEKNRNNVRETEEEDLVDVLLRIQKDNDFQIPLSLDNIKAVLKDVFFAGTETAATTTDWAMSELLKNPKAIGRDPKNWNDPEMHEPKRFLDTKVDYNFKGSNFEYIPIGAGRRICPGITFATPALELLLCNLLYHFDWKLPNGMRFEEFDKDESFGSIIRRKNELILVPIGYSP